MPGSILSFARRNLLGLTAIAFVAVPSSFALAASSASSTAEKTTRVCIVNKTGMLRYVATPGHCRAGEKSFFVSRRGVQGLRGVAGPTGARGIAGATGAIGTTGPVGARGAIGTAGAAGTNGTNGVAGTNGTAGTPGVQGTPGTNGTQGIQGVAGPASTLQYAEFFARMPSDNPATVASGTDILLPQNGPTQGSIARATTSSFTLATIGTYRVSFGASITEAAQLQLTLNNVGVTYAVFGRATGTGLVNGEAFITTTSINSVITVRNTSAGVVTLTPLAGGPLAVTAYLTIQQLS
jgi:hypothetical protein